MICLFHRHQSWAKRDSSPNQNTNAPQYADFPTPSGETNLRQLPVHEALYRRPPTST